MRVQQTGFSPLTQGDAGGRARQGEFRSGVGERLPVWAIGGDPDVVPQGELEVTEGLCRAGKE